MATITERRQALLARTNTETLIGSLNMLEATSGARTLTSEERLTHAWISDEITTRVPGLDEYVEASFDDLDDDRSYAVRIRDGLATLPRHAWTEQPRGALIDGADPKRCGHCTFYAGHQIHRWEGDATDGD